MFLQLLIMTAKKYFTDEEKRLAKRKWIENWRDRNRDIVNAKNRISYYKSHSTPLGHIKKNLSSIKRRAVKNNIPFDITIDDLLPFPEVCPVLNIPLSYTINKGRATANSPSIDRIIPKLGYVKGNVHIISNRANIIKHNASIEELVMLANYFKRFENAP